MTLYKTEYGPIHGGGPCRDDYNNIELYDQGEKGWPVLKLQRPAIKSLKEVEERWAKLTRPWKKRRHVRVTGTWRSCAYQKELYESDNNRYAPPDKTLHTRGLAIDIHTGFLPDVLLFRILRNHGWYQTRPADEPWHWSFRLIG